MANYFAFWRYLTGYLDVPPGLLLGSAAYFSLFGHFFLTFSPKPGTLLVNMAEKSGHLM